MSDAFPMIVACWAGQMDKSDEYIHVDVCKGCLGETRIGFRYCSLCSIQEELGQWKRLDWPGEVVLWD